MIYAILSLQSPLLHGRLVETVTISWVSLADVTKKQAHLGSWRRLRRPEAGLHENTSYHQYLATGDAANESLPPPSTGCEGSCMSLQRMVVFPALSRPRTNILASLSPNIDINLEIQMPMLASGCQDAPGSKDAAPAL